MEHTQIAVAVVQMLANMPRLSGMASIGIDGGHSSFKIAAAMLDTPTERFIDSIPTCSMVAVPLTDPDAMRDAIADTVTVGDTTYFVGATAIEQSFPVNFSGEARDWIKSPAHDALLVKAYQRAIAGLGCTPRVMHLVLGLPLAFFEAQKNDLKTHALRLLTPSLVRGQRLEILVQAQSKVPLKNKQQMADGTANPLYVTAEQSWAVIDIGHYTTDFSILMNAHFIETGGDSVAGASSVYSAVRARLTALDYDDLLRSTDQVIKTGFVSHQGKQIDMRDVLNTCIQPLREAIVSRAQSIIGLHSRRLNGVIVTGGIAPSIFNAIKVAFPTAVLDDDPINAIAEGLCRFGLFAHREWADRYAI